MSFLMLNDLSNKNMPIAATMCFKECPLRKKTLKKAISKYSSAFAAA